MGFADKHREKERETKEAAEHKAQEYATLSAEVEQLKTSNLSLQEEMEDLRQSIAGLTSALQGITPAKIDSVQQAGEHLFDPLKQTAAKVNEEIKAAAREAVDRVRSAGDKSWQEYAIQGAVTAAWYCAVTAAVMWWGLGIGDIKDNAAYTADKASVIHYNQTTGIKWGTYDPWHMKEYHDKLEEIKQQKLEAARQAAEKR